MAKDLKDDILRLLIDRVPNYVNERVLRRHLPAHDASEFEGAVENLTNNKIIDKFVDKREPIGRPIAYYRISSMNNLPIRESYSYGDLELPRVLSTSAPKMLPGDFDEVVCQLAEYANSLETRFEDLVKKERDAYWAKTISIFTIFVGLLAVVFQAMSKGGPDARSAGQMSCWQVFAVQQVVELIPLTIIFLVFALVLRWIVKN